jgi:signal transduction histidine kinase
MLRYYSIASLAIVVMAAGAMALIFRSVAVQGIERFAEAGNIAMAHLALNTMREALADYLAAARDGPVPLPARLHDEISELMRDSQIRRVKIYNDRGIVSFSTRSGQIGGSQANNPGFLAAMNGRVTVKLVHRDTFNPFDRATEEDNLVQSNNPVRRRLTEPVLGVFELYTDVEPLVHQAERAGIRLIASTVVILAVLYAALLLVVNRARSIIESQQQTIREKTAVLELLSQESLRREEGERKRFATDLHEGLAQSLSAVKLAVEKAQSGAFAGGAPDLNSIVGELQKAIGQVRAIAMDLRPPSLDDLGLVPSIDALCRDFGDAYPGIDVERRVTAAEAAIPSRLKFVIYRIIEAALKVIGQRAAATHVRIDLETHDHTLALTIEDDGSAPAWQFAAQSPEADPQSPFSAIHERTIISGGRLAVTQTPDGGLSFRATWSPVGGALPVHLRG